MYLDIMLWPWNNPVCLLVSVKTAMFCVQCHLEVVCTKDIISGFLGIIDAIF